MMVNILKPFTLSSENRNITMQSIFYKMKSSSHHVTELASHSLATVFFKFKIMVVQLIATISWLSSFLTQMHTLHINCITGNAYTREACILTPSRLFSRSRIPTMLTSFFSYRFLFNTSLRRSNRLCHSSGRCQLIMLRQS